MGVKQQDIKAQLIEEAEKMLVETQGRRLILSELAARVGISQPYAHKFFATKSELIRTLALMWFKQVEEESDRVAALDLPVKERVELWVLSILKIKREKFDVNPQLFKAYLELAASHMDLVSDHANYLRGALRSILSELVADDALEEVFQVYEDALTLFLMPHNIAQFRHRVTDERARSVLRVLRSTPLILYQASSSN